MFSWRDVLVRLNFFKLCANKQTNKQTNAGKKNDISFYVDRFVQSTASCQCIQNRSYVAELLTEYLNTVQMFSPLQ